jgi:hypothetical protein
MGFTIYFYGHCTEFFNCALGSNLYHHCYCVLPIFASAWVQGRFVRCFHLWAFFKCIYSLSTVFAAYLHTVQLNNLLLVFSAVISVPWSGMSGLESASFGMWSVACAAVVSLTPVTIGHLFEGLLVLMCLTDETCFVWSITWFIETVAFGTVSASFGMACHRELPFWNAQFFLHVDLDRGLSSDGLLLRHVWKSVCACNYWIRY